MTYPTWWKLTKSAVNHSERPASRTMIQVTDRRRIRIRLKVARGRNKGIKCSCLARSLLRRIHVPPIHFSVHLSINPSASSVPGPSDERVASEVVAIAQGGWSLNLAQVFTCLRSEACVSPVRPGPPRTNSRRPAKRTRASIRRNSYHHNTGQLLKPQ